MYPSQNQGYPQAGYPQGGYQQAGGYPAGGYPAAGYPQQDPNVTMHMGPATGLAGGPGAGGASNYGWTDPVGPFAEKAIRNAFVSKVYAILSVQLTFTSILIGVFVLNEDTKHYFARNGAWMFLGFAIFFVTYLILACVESTRRSFPLNFVLLGVLTLGYGLVAAIVSCRYNTQVVLYAFVATAISTFLVTLLAKTTSFDMTNCGMVLCLLGLAHLIIGSILIFFVPIKTTTLIISVSGAFLVSLYLMMDTQLILGGRKAELSPEEYILGAILLYVDIVQLFIYMLEIFNRLSDD